MDRADLHFETLAVQSGLHVRVGDVISTVPPIDASTTFTYDTVEAVHAALTPDSQGFAYARNANPTVTALERAVAALERAEASLAFSSGMAATNAAFLGAGLRGGDRIVAATDLYGVTRSLLTQLADLGIETTYVDMLDLDAVHAALPGARILYFESISNPLLRIADVEALVTAGHEVRALVIIDNTFATPYLFRPLEWGADLVVHSATKYIAGHGDVVAGLVAGSADRISPLRSVRTASGGILSPFEAWLTMRGMRTLPLRMARHSQNALQIAQWFQEQSWVERVYYPGLSAHEHHEIAARQFGGEYSGMVAVDVAANRDRTLRFIDSLQLIAPGTSLGDVASLCLYPPLSSHRTLTPEQLRFYGIGQGLVRFSVGLENPHDLVADLQQAARSAGILTTAEVASD